MQIQIKSLISGSVLFEGEFESIKKAVESANLSGADLSGANLRSADLRSADLRSADLSGANLRSANLDYIDWPLACRSMGMKLDLRLFAQFAAHFCVAIAANPDEREEIEAAQKALMPLALKSVHAKDLGLE